jgi:hypothetical protein
MDIPRVGLIGALSHPSPQVKRLLELADEPPTAVTSPRATLLSQDRSARHLTEHEIDQLVVAYQAGATVYQLAAQFHIHRTTVGKHLRAKGIDTRPAAFEPDDLQTAAELYSSGWSLAKIAGKYQVATETVRALLIEAGTEMRKPWERT